MQRNDIIYRRLLMLLLATYTFFANADNVEYLTFNVNGKPVVISLAEHPVITYTDNTLHITTTETTVEVPVSEVSGVAFSETTAINNIAIGSHQMKDGLVIFQQLAQGSQVYVYNTNGIKVLSHNADINGQAVIDIGKLPTGIYLIKTGNQSIKITNRK